MYPRAPFCIDVTRVIAVSDASDTLLTPTFCGDLRRVRSHIIHVLDRSLRGFGFSPNDVLGARITRIQEMIYADQSRPPCVGNPNPFFFEGSKIHLIPVSLRAQYPRNRF